MALGVCVLLAACGPTAGNDIEPVPDEGNASSEALMREAEQAAGNAEATMRFEADNGTSANVQGEMRK